MLPHVKSKPFVRGQHLGADGASELEEVNMLVLLEKKITFKVIYLLLLSTTLINTKNIFFPIVLIRIGPSLN